MTEAELVKKDPDIRDIIRQEIRQEIAIILKKDYRATTVHIDKPRGVDDTEAQLININEEKTDEFGTPLELFYKGTISLYERELFQETTHATALLKLKKWRQFREKIKNPKTGEEETYIIPANLAQIAMIAGMHLNLALNGNQAIKHINERRANAGQERTDDMLNKLMGWTGVRREKASKTETQEQYKQ